MRVVAGSEFDDGVNCIGRELEETGISGARFAVPVKTFGELD